MISIESRLSKPSSVALTSSSLPLFSISWSPLGPASPFVSLSGGASGLVVDSATLLALAFLLTVVPRLRIVGGSCDEFRSPGLAEINLLVGDHPPRSIS